MQELDRDAIEWVRRLAHLALDKGVLSPSGVVEFLDQVHVVAAPGSPWPRLVEAGLASLHGGQQTKLLLSNVWAQLADDDGVKRAAPLEAAVGRLSGLAGGGAIPDGDWLRRLGSSGPWDLEAGGDEALGSHVRELRLDVEARQEAIDEGFEAAGGLHEDLLASVRSLLARLIMRLPDAEGALGAG